MAIPLRLDKPWLPLTAEALGGLPGQLGVFQLADTGGRILYIGCADGRSRFGLRSAIDTAASRHPGARQYRYEVNMQYHSRYRELLMLYRSEHGDLPSGNEEEASPPLGRLNPR